uniref:Transcription termination factor 3, mitochondrial n=1 Tax=Arion vulgaris TaxID=1028688 RepID=A0A0B6ZN96_9EUPU
MMFQWTSMSMNCLKLQRFNFLDTSGDCWMIYPVKLLRIQRYLSSHSYKLSSDKLQHSFNLENQKSPQRCVKIENNAFQELDNMLSYSQKETSSWNTKKVTRDCVNNMSLCSRWSLRSFRYNFDARKSVQQTGTLLLSLSRTPSSHCLRSFSILCSDHSQRIFFLRESSAVSSGLCFSFGSTQGLKETVRFYRGRMRPQETGKESQEFDDSSGSEGEMSYRLPPTRKKEDQYKSCHVGQESTDVTVKEAADKDVTIQRKPVDMMTLPELSRASFNIVPYVKRSVTLQNLVRIGVNLDKVQRVAGMAEHLIKSNFDKDIVPYLKILIRVGVRADKIGYVFTVNPLLLKEPVEDLEQRIGYLLHKKFTLAEIADIIMAAPVTLLMNPVMLDDKLGYLQTVFNLTDHEVRNVVKLFPKILPYKKQLLMDVRFHILEFIGFDKVELKQLILKDPKIFASEKEDLVNNFDYLHNYMQLSHQQILVCPKIMRTRLHVFKNRHLFLMSLDRAQYDPCKENFVSLQALAYCMDDEFCQNVAKCNVNDFYDFCKTL